MITFRKFMVWLITVGAVFFIYLLYSLLVGSPEIQIDRSAEPAVDIEVPEFGAQTGETKVGNVERARFTVLDEETKKLKRVFGFEKLLNPNQADEKWKLQRPFMDIYDEKFFCQIESDRGKVQVETIAGKYQPTNAELTDNVVIKVYPVGDSKMVETTIYLDSLVYNSERSEYSTDGPVKVVSEEGTLEGTGLLLIYNNELTRIEFLRIIELDYLKLKNISRISSPAKSPGEPAALETSRTSESSADVKVKPEPQVPSEEPGSVKIAAADPQPGASSSEQTPDQADLYTCQFNDQVVIQYGGELVATGREYIAINNILWSEAGEDKNADEDLTVIDPQTKPQVLEPVVSQQSSDIKVDEAPAVVDSQTKPQVLESDVPVEPSSPESAAQVIVTCSGDLVLKPKESLIRTNAPAGFKPGQNANAGSDKPDLYAKYTSMMTLEPDEAEGGELETPPSLFGAERIDYDMTTGEALAAGPVKFKFYSAADSETEFSDGPIPSLITAKKNTEFFADAERTVNRIVFNGDVVGAQNTETPGYLQTNSFFGQQLIVDLNPDSNDSGTDIKHVTVKGGKVKLESQRVVDDVTINHVRLTGTRIDYNTADDLVTAAGPGDIQINNENAPVLEKDTGSKLSLKRPCFALIYGYDKLHWFIPQNRITADGKSNSVNMSYLPIVDGQRGQVIRASTSHLQVDFIETVTGRSELATLRTTGGIHYEETGGVEFIGDKLFFNAAEDLMTISSSQERPAFANGARIAKGKFIEYNLKSGKIKTRLSTSPGTISFPSRKK